MLILLSSVRILTTLLSPEEVGNYYIATTILAFFNLVFLNPTGVYFTRNLLQWERSRNLVNALIVFLLYILIVVIFTIPIIIILFNITNYSEKFNLYTFIFFIFLALIISTTHRNMLASINTLGYRKSFVIFLNLTLIIGLVASFILVNFYQDNSLSWLFGIIVGEVIMLIAIYNIFSKGNDINLDRIKLTISRDRIIKIMQFIIPIGFATFLMWGQNMSYRFIVDFKYSPESLAFIAVGLGISSGVFGSIETISMQYYNPIFLKDILDADKQKRAKAWNKMAKILIPIYLLAMVFVICLSEVLITILVDSRFHDSYIFTMVGASIEFFRVITNLLNNVSQSERQTYNTILPFFTGFLIVFITLIVFDFSNNLIMISLVLSLAYLFTCLIMYIQMKKLLNIRIEVDILKILILSSPFSLVFVLPTVDSLITSLIYLTVFGIYFIFCSWFLLRKVI